jgi:CO dehydrogenase nickel-insertion accessory protein CooC1
MNPSGGNLSGREEVRRSQIWNTYTDLSKRFKFSYFLKHLMRISVVSVKGGVGKSTISFHVGITAARAGLRTLIIDRDPTGYISKRMGLQTQGLLHSTITGEMEPFYAEVNVGKGVLGVLRIYPDSPLLFEEAYKVHRDPTLKQKFYGDYKSFLQNHDFSLYLVDNPPNIWWSDEVVINEYNNFVEALPKVKPYRLYVSDPSPMGITSCLNYAKKIEEYAPTEDPPIGLVVNMVPPFPDELELAKREAVGAGKELRVKVVAVIPFDERLYSYRVNRMGESMPEQIEELAKALLNPVRELIVI